MNRPTTKQIIEWLQSRLGNEDDPCTNPLWERHRGSVDVGVSADGDTIFGDAYTINYDALEKEMDAWIASEFPATEESDAFTWHMIDLATPGNRPWGGFGALSPKGASEETSGSPPPHLRLKTP